MERRLAAIVATDVVGYSRLMAADEAGTHARLKALRKDFLEPKTAEYHGRIVKLMGDGSLIEFASVVDAVECAAALQNGVAERQGELPEDQRIAFRIGINIGDIIIEDGDIYGDGVNVAARLEGLAEPGGVCVALNAHPRRMTLYLPDANVLIRAHEDYYLIDRIPPFWDWAGRAGQGQTGPQHPGNLACGRASIDHVHHTEAC